MHQGALDERYDCSFPFAVKRADSDSDAVCVAGLSWAYAMDCGAAWRRSGAEKPLLELNRIGFINFSARMKQMK